MGDLISLNFSRAAPWPSWLVDTKKAYQKIKFTQVDNGVDAVEVFCNTNS